MIEVINFLPQFLQKMAEILVNNLSAFGILTDKELNKVKAAFDGAVKSGSKEFDLVRGDIDAIIESDPALSGKSDKREVFFYAGIRARFFHEVAHGLYLHEKFLLARSIAETAKSLTGLDIHPGATIGKRLAVDHGMGIVIGETAIIGDDVVMFHGVTLGGTGKQTGKRHPTVGNNVFIGCHSVLLGSIEIGDNVRIGANSTILSNIPENTTCAGVLATIKKYHDKK